MRRDRVTRRPNDRSLGRDERGGEKVVGGEETGFDSLNFGHDRGRTDNLPGAVIRDGFRLKAGLNRDPITAVYRMRVALNQLNDG